MKFFVLIICIIVSTSLSAQESIFDEIKLADLERLVELAKQNYPEHKMMEKNVSTAKTSLAAARISYLDVFNANYFYRPRNRATINPDNPYVVNGFQFGISLSPGALIQKPFQVRQAKNAYEITKLEREAYEVTLANEVKSRYYDYVLSLNDIALRTQSSQDAQTMFEDAKLKFERGEIENEDYVVARETLVAANMALQQAEVAFLKIKDALEEFIGVDISTIRK